MLNFSKRLFFIRQTSVCTPSVPHPKHKEDSPQSLSTGTQRTENGVRLGPRKRSLGCILDELR